jgi:hypothetical protein
MILGPDSGCSRLKLVRLHWPESSGIDAAFAAPIVVQTSMAAEKKPKTANHACLAELIPIADSHMAAHPSLRDWSARQNMAATVYFNEESRNAWIG